MGVATFIIFIYLGAGFSNGKSLGELLSPFDLFGFIFWLYIGFLVILFFAVPSQKQGQEIGEKLKKEEGEFKVLYWTSPQKARRMASQWAYKDSTSKDYLYSEWYQEMYQQEMVLLDWCVKIEQAKKDIVECKRKIEIANGLIRDRKLIGEGEDDAKIKEYREVIEKNKMYIEGDEENIEKYTKKLALLGWDEHRQPLAPRTWDDVYEHIREYRTML